MKTKYYIPIKSVNLGHYFAKGCICPVLYLEERNNDVQNIFDSYILLSKEKFATDTNCSIEVILTEKEIQNNLEVLNENFRLLKTFIPISRIVKVYFKNQDQANNTTWDINQVRAFIPKRMISISNDDDTDINNLHSFSKKNKFDNSTLLEKYNRLLGGFALMRLGGENYMNYSLNYFKTLSNINLKICDEYKMASSKSTLLSKNNNLDYSWLIFNNNEKFKELYNLTYSKINESVFIDYAKKEKIRYKERLGKIDLNSIDKGTSAYLIAILASYSNIGARLTIDNFISDLVHNKLEKKEGLSFMFGINKGYDRFRNSYKTENFEAVVKFKLDNQIDYYTIESIYQFVFGAPSESFSYLDFVPTTSTQIDKNKYSTYTILGNDVAYSIKESKLSVKDLIKDLISSIKQLFFSKTLNELYLNFEDILESELAQYAEKMKQQQEEQYRSIINEQNIKISKLEEKLAEKERIKLEASESLHETAIRRKQLSTLTLDKLKEEAKRLDIRKLSEYNSKNKDRLVELIMEKEKAPRLL